MKPLGKLSDGTVADLVMGFWDFARWQPGWLWVSVLVLILLASGHKHQHTHDQYGGVSDSR